MMRTHILLTAFLLTSTVAFSAYEVKTKISIEIEKGQNWLNDVIETQKSKGMMFLSEAGSYYEKLTLINEGTLAKLLEISQQDERPLVDIVNEINNRCVAVQSQIVSDLQHHANTTLDEYSKTLGLFSPFEMSMNVKSSGCEFIDLKVLAEKIANEVDPNCKQTFSGSCYTPKDGGFYRMRLDKLKTVQKFLDQGIERIATSFETTLDIKYGENEDSDEDVHEHSHFDVVINGQHLIKEVEGKSCLTKNCFYEDFQKVEVIND